MDLLEFYQNNSIEIDLDFDENFYQNEYPDLSGYWYPWAKDNGFSEKQRLFHHYYLHGKKERRFGSAKQKYEQALENKQIVFANQLDIKIKDSIISINSNKINWQLPACTEKLYFYNHAFVNAKIEEYYVSFPWATFIDRNMILDDKTIEKIKNIISMIYGKKHTICQHIRYSRLVAVWEELGITDVHLCHYEKNIKDTDKVKFHPWALIAANYENKDRSRGLSIKVNKNKKYLASFIGAYKKSYRSTTRLDLKNILEKEKEMIYEIKDEWFYDKIVNYQIKNEKLSKEYLESYEKETQRYNNILSDSIFSLCPEGTGPNTIRLWESMAIGVIPVIFSDDWIPPKITGLEWNDFSVFIKREDLKDTIHILRSFSEEELEQMKLNCINAYKYFRQMDCFTN